jgi:hypothetical protein
VRAGAAQGREAIVQNKEGDCAMKRLHVHVAVEDLTQQCNKFPLTSSAE